MSPSLSVRVFGFYLLATAAALIVAPNAFLGLLDVPPTTEVWIRVVGMLVGFLGVYYVLAAAAGLRAFFAWTVPLRASVLVIFAAFVGLEFAPPQLLLFGVIDVLGAAWTWIALRRSA